MSKCKMRSIYLVSCARTKRKEPAAGCDLYVSALFSKSKQLAQGRSDDWYILSAKHGLLSPEKVIEPYEVTLKTMSRDERINWAERVFTDVVKYTNPNTDRIVILAGNSYRQNLLPLLERAGYSVETPIAGLSIGRQLQWLNHRLGEKDRERDLSHFYLLLEQLEQSRRGKTQLAQCDGRMKWPSRGVYFFFHDGEVRAKQPHVLRVVRVGTHAVSAGSNSTLWDRLRTHRGGADGSGNHRGSIFRLHVGEAVINQSNGGMQIPTWGRGQVADADVRLSESELEKRVSEFIGSMSLLWLAIGEEPGPTSDRAFIEQNSIALLAGRTGPIDPPSAMWLGRWSSRPSIRKSGLWNVNYVEDDYDPRFLEILGAYIDATLDRRPMPGGSLAPPGWTSAKRHPIDRRQLPLFRENGIK